MISSMTPLQKTNRLLQIIAVAFLLIGFRIWHLAVIQREDKLIEAQKPQRRTQVQRADRGSIIDRFGVPLAVNRICYNASICYNELAQVPSSVLREDPESEGQKKRVYPRKEYIQRLCDLLAQELPIDAKRLEDLIYAKASLFPHIPFVIASSLTERQYYRLKALERQWLGLHAEIGRERFYPQNSSAGHVLGYLGAISQREYLDVAGELESLRQMLGSGGEEESLALRYQELKEKAYTINDLIGKAGIEKYYEQQLRGFYGKKTFEIDQRGNALRELPGGRDPIPGKTVELSLSIELQKFCESLLSQDEVLRDKRSIGQDVQTKTRKVLKQPWIKGGAIIALDPKTGEVIALAGEPGFDPNDFILSTNREEKLEKLHRWQESEHYISDLWDGKNQLYRKRHSREEKALLSWELWLDFVLPLEGPLRDLFAHTDDIKSYVFLQEDFEALLYFANDLSPIRLIEQLFKDKLSLPAAAQPHRRRIEQSLSKILDFNDKLFALDLCRMAVYAPAFTDEVLAKVGSMKVSTYRSLTQEKQRVEGIIKEHCRTLFNKTAFQAWRELHQKDFLQQKRQEEKERKTYPRPYLDYLDKKEKELFENLWEEIRFPLLAAHLKKDPLLLTEENRSWYDASLCLDWKSLEQAAAPLNGEECAQWFRAMRSFKEMNRPLWGSYKSLRNRKIEQTEKDLAAAFYPTGGFGYCRSHAFQLSSPPGSLFKLVVATEAIRQRGVNPLTLIDETRTSEKNLIVATSLDNKPFYRHYKGGRLPKSHAANLGKVDLIGAIEQSSNPYFSIIAGDFLSDPNDLIRAAAEFGFGEKTGLDLPSESRGRLPNDLQKNRTGLYSSAIGQHTLEASALQTAIMLSAIANGGEILTPTLARSFQGASLDRPSTDCRENFFAKDELAILGIDFPIFTAAASSQNAPTSEKNRRPIRRTISFPHQIRQTLLEGMDRVVWGAKGSARPNGIKGLYKNPLLLHLFLSLQHQMVGKTGTSEILYRLDKNPSAEAQMYKNIWFGAISFKDPKTLKDPDLVVVVYLRYGDGGKEAAPLAAQVISKWRDLNRLPSKNLSE